MNDDDGKKRPPRSGGRPDGRPTGGDRPARGPSRGDEGRFKGGPKGSFKGAPRDGKPGFKPRDASLAPRRRPAAEDEGTPRGTERIAKRLARAGLASRRDAEALITDGRVTVNGRVLDSPAFNVQAGDVIAVDGTAIPPIERTRLFLFHKPGGVVTTNRDPEGRRTIFDVLPAGLPRLMSIGRLDINTEGLLLLTNDGGLARVLELPATGWLRRYRVRVHGKVDEKALASLKDGIAVDGIFYGAIEASLEREQGSNAWLSVGLREGKNREVKNVMGALGLEVNRLIRVSYGPFQLGELPEGSVLELKGRMLRDQLGDRLIAEAGADFDAPVITPFSNSPVEGEAAPPPEPRAPEPSDDRRAPRPRRPDRDEVRRGALDRLSTQRGRGGEERQEQRPRSRGANVWMAPGARPQGKKKDEPEDAAPRSSQARTPRKDFAGDRPPRRESGDRPPRREGGPRKDAPARAEGDARPTRRFDNPRTDKPRTDKPRFEKPPGDGVARAPREDRPPRREGGPRKDAPARAEGDARPTRRFDKSGGFDKPRSDRPRFEKPGADAPRSPGERPPRKDFAADRAPRGADGRPGSKPAFGASRSGSPRSGAPGDRPGPSKRPRPSGKPFGGAGGKPSGGPRGPRPGGPRGPKKDR